ncbi:MAG: hypothetical protein IH624_03890 [Phycisphaerae bacterium]|nr:hypothetical protein [Phycisphaerae bacterium]
MLYLRLFHGRKDPAQEMDDWGADGPIFGPYRFIHTTYGAHVTLGLDNGEMHDLYTVESMIYYDGVYYGDWSVFTEETSLKEAGFSAQPYDGQKAKLPEKDGVSTGKKNPPVKIVVYVMGGLCQDVKTNLPDDSCEYAIVDYDNEPGLPDNHVPYAAEDMKTLPSIPVLLELADAAKNVVRNWESGDLAGPVRRMAEILDRIEHA